MMRRPSGFWIVSVALHIVLGAGLLYVITVPGSLDRWFRTEREPPIPVERIGFLAAPNQGEPTPGRSGGDGRPVRRVPQPRITPPPDVPTGIEPAAPVAAPQPEGGSGPVVGAGGVTEGVKPSYDDPRIWARPAPYVTAPRTRAESLVTELRARIEAHNDSVGALAAGRKPGDWTFEKNGKKYGLDQNKIYLGDITLPSVLLALLPINKGQGNPVAIERERGLARMNADIQFQAQRAMNEDEFRAAVKRIRERKERERREAEEQKQKVQAP